MSTQRDVRLWAQSKGFPVPDCGRIPESVIAGYNAQHPDDPCPTGRGGQWLNDPVSPDAATRHDVASKAANARWHGHTDSP